MSTCICAVLEVLETIKTTDRSYQDKQLVYSECNIIYMMESYVSVVIAVDYLVHICISAVCFSITAV